LDKVVGILAIIAGFITWKTKVFFMGNIGINLTDENRIYYALPEIIIGLYFLYYGVQSNK
jgi:hypothetical protein